MTESGNPKLSFVLFLHAWVWISQVTKIFHKVITNRHPQPSLLELVGQVRMFCHKEATSHLLLIFKFNGILPPESIISFWMYGLKFLIGYCTSWCISTEWKLTLMKHPSPITNARLKLFIGKKMYSTCGMSCLYAFQEHCCISSTEFLHFLTLLMTLNKLCSSLERTDPNLTFVANSCYIQIYV